jgi:hypothetical protein
MNHSLGESIMLLRHQAAVLALLLLATIASSHLQAEGWMAGAAKIEITPEKPMWMSGYGSRDRPAEGKLTELWAKALVLEDADGHRGVLLTLDLVGIDRTMSGRIRARLQERFGFTEQDVMICASHTHTGPVVGGNLSPLHYLIVDEQQQERIEEYADALPEHIASVVAKAIDRLESVTLTWGNGRATFAVNRRNNTQSDAAALRTARTLVGPVDHDVPVLAVRNDARELTAVVFGYACHATVLSFYQWSGDYPGFAQIELEELHPGAMALFFAGCGADQNPLPRRSIELAKHYGRRLADAVDAVLLTSKMTPVESEWKRHYGEVNLPLAPLPTTEEIQKDALSKDKYVAARARSLTAKIERDGSLSPTYPYPIGVWELGEQIQWVFLGGEVVVDFAIRLKAELHDGRTWVAGYANDVMAYIPSRRVLLEGGYEGGGAMVYYGLPTIWAPEVEEVIIEGVHDVIK